MDTITLEGIVIGSIAYKESSKIVYLYTKMGRISLRALGSLKQKKGMLPLITTMNHLEVIVTDKEFPSVIDYTLKDSYNDVKEDLRRNLWASYMLEIVSKLTPDSPHERIYELLKRCLERIKEEDPVMIGTIFQLKMMYGFGVSPMLKKCVLCDDANTKYFSIKNGGALCGSHYHIGAYDNNILNDIKRIYYFDIYNGNILDISDINYLEMFKLINIYYENHIHIFLKGMNSLIF